MKTKWGLALGAGGMWGLAHIGVLRVLEREGFVPDCIAGCSIGSLIASLYCSGIKAETLYKLAKSAKRRHWLDFCMSKFGLLAGERMIETLNWLLQDKSFEDLKIPLNIVATELGEGKEFVFSQGKVVDAVRASVSVPGVFIPCEREGKRFVDGAVLNPTPLNLLSNMGAQILVGVDLVHARKDYEPRNLFDVIFQSINIMERELFQTKAHVGHVLIRPEVGCYSPSSFNHVEELILIGEEATQSCIAELKSLLTAEHNAEIQ